MKINEAAHVTLFHDGEGRGGTGKEFAREGTGSTKPVGTRGAFGKFFDEGDGEKSRNTRRYERTAVHSWSSRKRLGGLTF